MATRKATKKYTLTEAQLKAAMLNPVKFFVKSKISDAKVLEELIRDKPFDIKYVNNPSKKLQLIAVRNCGASIGCIKNPCEEVQGYIVKCNISKVQYMKTLSFKNELEVIKKGYFHFLKNPSKEAIIWHIKSEPTNIGDLSKRQITPDVEIAAYNEFVKRKTPNDVIKYWIPKPCEKLKELMMFE